MALKTFNVDEQSYKEYSKYCKKEGISMSRQIENFIKDQLKGMPKSGKYDKNNKVSKDVKEKAAHLDHAHNGHSFQKYC